MKSTGVVRKIDELGRIVIPKEIRSVFKIHDGDQLEIFTNSDGDIVFKKYSPVNKLSAIAQQYADVLSKYVDLPFLVCDCDYVVSVAGAPYQEYIKRPITNRLEEYMKNGKSFVASEGRELKPVQGIEQTASIVCPIMNFKKAAGAVILLHGSHGKIPEQTELALVQFAAEFLGKQLEE